MNHNATYALRQQFGDKLSLRWIDRLALSHDASFYRLVPEAVLRPTTSADIVYLFKIAKKYNQHLTFRAAGTSLSGQAVSDGILVDISRGWDFIEILDDGAKVQCGPGITGLRVNNRLHRFGKKIGPDPASLQAAMIGGIVANNASGMCCGVKHNSYHTIDSMCFILPSGNRYNTSNENEDDRLSALDADVYAALQSVRNAIRSNKDLSDKILSKYQIKNTIGYSLNAFLDFDDPIDILSRLLVGSEGTLGFVESVVFNTIPDAREKHTNLFVYPSLDEACAAIEHWESQGAAAIELMDDASIASYATLPRTPDRYRSWQPGIAALLVEFHDLVPPSSEEWLTSEADRQVLWSLRKGLMPTVGARRQSGTTMINEDIAVAPHRLRELVADVKSAFDRFEYKDAIIFGHAKDGNIHFVISQDFSLPSEVRRYSDFMEAIADIVVGKFNGSLKAEHGTGRNMAAFVPKEWGDIAVDLMWQIKKAIDPDNILNPDVLLTLNTELHLQNIKPVPSIDTKIDTCIECGFCEWSCPTTDITLTPRQRIVIERELSQSMGEDVRREVETDRQWMSIDSCAVDGVCSWNCPVGINTGAWVKQVRAKHRSSESKSFAQFASNNWNRVDTLVRGARTLGNVFAPEKTKHLGTASFVPSQRANNPAILFVPGCPSRWFGSTQAGYSDVQAFLTLCERANVPVTVVDSPQICCGQPLDSEGFAEIAKQKVTTSLQSIDELVSDRSVPIVTDVSTCSHVWMESRSVTDRLVLTPAKFLTTVLLPKLVISSHVGEVILHPGCGSIATGDSSELVSVLQYLADTVTVPDSASCCGMAGAHGLRHPEIVTAALKREVSEIKRANADVHLTLNPMCQSALAKQSGVEWTSIWKLIEQLTRIV